MHDFADEIERLAGHTFLDAVLYNTELPSQALLKKYATQGEKSVGYNDAVLKNRHYLAAGAKLLSGSIWKNTNASDPIAAARTLIRHDSDAVAGAIIELYEYHRADK